MILNIDYSEQNSKQSVFCMLYLSIYNSAKYVFYEYPKKISTINSYNPVEIKMQGLPKNFTQNCNAFSLKMSPF